jgi:hypothetical protein
MYKLTSGLRFVCGARAGCLGRDSYSDVAWIIMTGSAIPYRRGVPRLLRPCAKL